MRDNISVIITDIDNTLFDWFEFWYYPFKEMLEDISKKSGIDEDILKSEIRVIFQKYKTTEYPFLIQEIESLKKKYQNNNFVQSYKDIIDNFKQNRKKYLKLYHAVYETLSEISKKGTLLIGFTESMAFYTTMRIKCLELDGILNYVYTAHNHVIPETINLNKFRNHRNDYYELTQTKLKLSPKESKKPDSSILLKIIKDVNADPKKTVYIGDSLSKDVLMAKNANIISVHAKYGTAHKREEYDLLRSVTHWTDEEVEKEKSTNSESVKPDFILNNSFGQIKDFFNFSSFLGNKNGTY
jgi:phosphoglycolate phosphatase